MDSIFQPGVFITAGQGDALYGSLFLAASDVCIVIAAIALIALISSGIEKLFKTILKQFMPEEKVGVLEGWITYPGVVYHEASHALFAFLTGAKITEFSLRRRQLPNGATVLGSVSFIPSNVRPLAAIEIVASGVAPAIMGLLGMTMICLFAFPNCTEWWQWVIWIYLFVCILLHSELSPQDVKSASRGIPVFVILLFVIFLIVPFDPLAMAQALAGAEPVGISGIFGDAIAGGGAGTENLVQDDPHGVAVDPNMYT